jgi:WD40 repeat protein
MHMLSAHGPPPAIGVFVVGAASGKLVHDYSSSEQRSVSSITWSPDGKTIAYARPDAVVLADPQTGKVRTTLAVSASSTRFAADGKSLFVLDGKGRLARWDLATRRADKPLATGVSKLAVSPDGSHIVTSSDAELRVIDVATGSSRVLATSFGYTELPPVFSPDGRFVTQAGSWMPRTWDVETGARVPIRGHWSAITSIACDGKRIVTAGSDGETIVWDLAGNERARLPARVGSINGVRFSRDGKRLLLPGADKTVVIWDLETATATALRGHTSEVAAALWLDDGRIVSAGNRELFVWRDGKIEQRLPAEEGRAIGALALSPDGATLATGSTKTLLWDTTTLAKPRAVEALADGALALAYAPDGQTLLGGGTNWLLVADATGHENNHDHVIGKHYTAVAFAPDGAWVFAAGWQESGIYSFPGLAELAHFDDGLTAGAVCADGKHVITANPDGTAIVWSTEALLGEARP